MYKMGIFDGGPPSKGSLLNNVTSAAHNKVARDIAVAATVLLKNANNTLPISTAQQPTRSPSFARDMGVAASADGEAASAPLLKIAVLGSAADEKPIVSGGGSGAVQGPYIITGLQGIQQRCSPSTGTAVCNVTYVAGEANPSALAAATAVAKEADVAIVFAGVTSSEGFDRKTLALHKSADDLIEAVAMVQSRTVVVLTNPGAMLTPWRERVAAIVSMFYPGQEMGSAAADVLFGDANPSGRLPVTFPNKDNEVGFTKAQFPGVKMTATYTEKLLVGYRWYHAKGVQPAFCFGHGLSYSKFRYSDLTSAAKGFNATVTAKVTNTGSRAGSEVAQLYLTFPSSAGEPPLQLKSFSKVLLQPGESKIVQFDLTRNKHLSVWDADTHKWSAVLGTFDLAVGASSCDFRLKGTLVVSGTS
jgi:beta-glucosidase